MEKSLLSKLSMATGAEYSLDIENYDYFVSRNRVIEKQFGELPLL